MPNPVGNYHTEQVKKKEKKNDRRNFLVSKQAFTGSILLSSMPAAHETFWEACRKAKHPTAGGLREVWDQLGGQAGFQH